MFGLRFGKPKERVAMVLDVKSDGAIAAVVSSPSGLPVALLASEHRALPAGTHLQEVAAATIADAAKEVAVQAAQIYAKQSGSLPVHACYAIVHPPWCRSKTVSITKRYSRQTRITGELLADAAQEAIRAESGNGEGVIFETTIIRVLLDGYLTTAPIGKLARRVDISCLVSDADVTVLKNIRELLQSICTCEPVLRSRVRALYRTLRIVMPALSDYLLIDVGGNETYLAAVHESAIAGNAAIPEGLQTMAQRISQGASPEDTMSTMRMLARDECSSAACDALLAAMARSEVDLVKMFGETMAKMAAERKLPNTLVLVAPVPVRHWLSQCFSRIDFAQFTITTQPFVVKVLSPEDMAPLVQSGPGVEVEVDVGIAAALVNSERVDE